VSNPIPLITWPITPGCHDAIDKTTAQVVSGKFFNRFENDYAGMSVSSMMVCPLCYTSFEYRHLQEFNPRPGQFYLVPPHIRKGIRRNWRHTESGCWSVTVHAGV